MTFLLILATAIATAAATQGAVFLKDKLTADHEGRFSALYAALFFERYASECAAVNAETEDHISSDGHAGIQHRALADLPFPEEEVDWQRVGIKLTEAAFAFRLEVETGNEIIAQLYGFDPPDGGDWDVRRRSVERGIRAIRLGRDFRKAAKVGAAPVFEGCSVEGYLTDCQRGFDERKAKMLADQAAAIEAHKLLDKPDDV